MKGAAFQLIGTLMFNADRSVILIREDQEVVALICQQGLTGM